MMIASSSSGVSVITPASAVSVGGTATRTSARYCRAQSTRANRPTNPGSGNASRRGIPSIGRSQMARIAGVAALTTCAGPETRQTAGWSINGRSSRRARGEGETAGVDQYVRDVTPAPTGLGKR
jgi:hypothetical protein